MLSGFAIKCCTLSPGGMTQRHYVSSAKWICYKVLLIVMLFSIFSTQFHRLSGFAIKCCVEGSVLGAFVDGFIG